MEWFRRQMMGRRGPDRLGTALIVASMVALVLRNLTDWRMFYLLSLALLTAFFLRFFSRNLMRREQEEEWFLGWFGRLRGKFSSFKRAPRAPRDNTYVYFKCPSCGQKLRLPRGRGKVLVTCSHCRKEFMRKT